MAEMGMRFLFILAAGVLLAGCATKPNGQKENLGEALDQVGGQLHAEGGLGDDLQAVQQLPGRYRFVRAEVGHPAHALGRLAGTFRHGLSLSMFR